MDCSLPGSSVHGILQTRILERVAISLMDGSCHFQDPGIFLTQKSNPGFLHCKQIFYQLELRGKPYSQGKPFLLREQTVFWAHVLWLERATIGNQGNSRLDGSHQNRWAFCKASQWS